MIYKTLDIDCNQLRRALYDRCGYPNDVLFQLFYSHQFQDEFFDKLQDQLVEEKL